MPTTETNLVTLKTTIIKVVFEKDGFIIAKTIDGDTVQGNVHHQTSELEKTEVELKGDWNTHEKYGKGFYFTSYSIMGNYDLFFLTRMIKGITKKTAIEILSKAKNLAHIIENDSRALLSIRGIGEKKLALIVKTFNENKPFQDLASVLLPYGISPAKVRQIFNYYKDKNISAINEIRKNPYVLTRMDGIGFKRADEIALKMGTDAFSSFRIQSGIEYAIKEYSMQGGHTYCELPDLFTLSANVLDVEGVEVESDIDNVDGLHETKKTIQTFQLTEETFMVEVGSLMIVGRMVIVGNDTQKVSIPYIEKAERYIRETVNKYAYAQRSTLVADVESYIDTAERRNGFRFGEQQKEAIRLGNMDFPITFCFGLAGSGKTTVSKTILDLYGLNYGAENIRCCSLSGVASARSQNVTGYQGQTIHSLLRYKGGANGFEFNEENKLPHRLILLDESSMTDSFLFASLLRAIDFEKSTLICVGDYSQLPSIGSGQVFRDIIEKQYCNGTGLDEVFRQSNEQVINIFATNYIRKGLVPEGYKDNTWEDFFFYPVEIENQWAIKKKSSDAEWKVIREANNERIAQMVEAVARNHVGIRNLYEQKDLKGYISGFQVIAPQKKGTVGVYELNNRIQKVLNPYEYPSMLKVFGKTFKPRDKVIHLQNVNKKVCSRDVYKAHRGNISAVVGSDLSVERKVFNGQVGVILDLSLDDEDKSDVISVYYPDEDYIAFYTPNDFETGMIDLSWCISIHKSQGSEYENLCVVFSMSHYNMLSNELTYTAVTRAKKRLYVVGESFAFEKGIKQFGNNARKTILSLDTCEEG